MSDRAAHLAVYRRLSLLYPRSFRDDYDADLVAVFAQQLRDEPPGRVWLRTLRDLAVSVPTQHLEARMSSPSPHVVTATCAVVAATAGALTVTIGTGPAMPAFALVTLVFAAIAYWSWEASRPARGVGPSAGQLWWKFLVAGCSLAGLTLLATVIPWPESVDLGDNAYWALIISLGASLVLGASGLLLGIGALIQRRRPGRSGASPA